MPTWRPSCWKDMISVIVNGSSVRSIWSLNHFSEGTGTFGRVRLVRHLDNGKFYALKISKKASIIRMKQVCPRMQHERGLDWEQALLLPDRTYCPREKLREDSCGGRRCILLQVCVDHRFYMRVFDAGGAREERGFAPKHDRAPCHSKHVSLNRTTCHPL